MKKLYTLTMATAITGTLLAGGIVTNTNQSAHFVRLLSRNASTQIDAVYFNPAGLVKLDDGFHLAFSNQTIMQEKTVVNDYQYLNNHSYVGDVMVPSFPSFQAAYKMDKLVISLGFGPNGGGGSAEFSNGLPSFEMPYTSIPFLVSALGPQTDRYSAEIYFNGSSVYWGTQLNASYAINENYSISGGVRMINAKNVYEGSIKNVQIDPVFPGNPTGELISAPAFFTAVGQPVYAAMTSNMDVYATQTGMAFTPIIGANATFGKLNIGVKYEFNTNLELTNESEAGKDANGMFKNDSTFRSDIPAILGVGVEYDLLDNLRASFSWTLYFDKNADWNGKEEYVDKNFNDFAFGLEYDLNEKLTLSAGYMYGKTGVNEKYQSDLSYSNSSSTIGLGGRFNVTENLSIDLGALFTSYVDDKVSYPNPLNPALQPYNQTYDKSLMDFAIGLNYKF